MGEKFLGDDPTGIREKAKQKSLDVIRLNIENLLNYGVGGTVIDKTISDISSKDIDNYLKHLITSKSLFQKLLLLTSSSINNLELFRDLCDYTDISGVDFPQGDQPKIYFLETSDFAISIIPIELKDGNINIHMEPLEDSHDFITEIWADSKDRKSMDNIEFVDYKTL